MASSPIARSPRRRSLKPHAKFSPEDDDRLRSAIENYGTTNWAMIAYDVGGKNARQCKERWFNYLSPELNCGEWTCDDDILLIQKFTELGNKWVRIAKCFPNRTDSMVKNRFNKLQRRERKSRELWIQSELYLMRTFGPTVKVPPPPHDIGMMSPKPLEEEEIAFRYPTYGPGAEANPWDDRVVGDEWQGSFGFSVDSLSYHC
jgi:hypothetical protein